MFYSALLTSKTTADTEQRQQTPGIIMATAATQDDRSLISLSALNQHNSKTDCWIAVHSKVWDITDFINEHPGGPSGE